MVISLLPASPYHKRFAMDNGKEGLQKWDGKKPVVCTVGIHKNFFRHGKAKPFLKRTAPLSIIRARLRYPSKWAVGLEGYEKGTRRLMP